MRNAAVLLLLVLAACASPGGGSDPGTAGLPTPVRVQTHDEQGSVTEYSVRRSNLFVSDTLWDVTPSTTWEAVQAVYTAFGIPVTRVDAATRTVGAENARAGSRIAGAALSNFLECGTNPTGGSTADNAEVTLTVLTSLHPMEGGGIVTRTTVNGSARNRFRNVPPSACRSTGRLERRIANEIKLRLSGVR
ncbi:MAG TPA: hypothetical protein VHG91_02970 [Longimicrobium sp.]|nr:hypothetical protein [Longimicrobium sp.]